MYRYLDEHNLLNPNQSRFRPKDLLVYQLIEITHFFPYLIVIQLLKLGECF